MVNKYALCLKDKIEKLYTYDCMNTDQAVIFFAQIKKLNIDDFLNIFNVIKL